MATPQQIYVLTGVGTPALNLVCQALLDEMRGLGHEDKILAIGARDHNRVTTSYSRQAAPQGATYLGSDAARVEQSLGFVGDKQIAKLNRAAWVESVASMDDAHIRAARGANLVAPFAVCGFSYTGGHQTPAIHMMRDLAARLPREHRMGLTVVPHEKGARDRVRDDVELPAWLVDEHLVDCSVVVDNRSAIVQRYGRAFQDGLVAKAAAGMMAGIWMFPNQRGPADIAHDLGRYGALVGLSVGIRYLVGRPLGWYEPVRSRFGLAPKVRQGDVEDTVLAIVEAATDALTDPAWQALDEPISAQKPAFLVITLPLKLGKLRDASSWRPVIAEVENWLDNEHSFVTPLFVSGPGLALPELAAEPRAWLLCSLFYPMRDRPRAIEEILRSPSLLRRRRGADLPAVATE